MPIQKQITTRRDALGRSLAKTSNGVRAAQAGAEETLLTMDDIKTRLGIKRDETVLRLIRTGGLPMVKISGKWHITRRAYRRAMHRYFKPPKR